MIGKPARHRRDYYIVSGTIPTDEEAALAKWAEDHSMTVDIYNSFREDGHYSIRVDGVLDFILYTTDASVAILAKLTWGGR